MIDMSKAAVTERLRRCAARADLRAERRLAAKLDMNARGITARLRKVEALRRLCVQLARLGEQAT